MLALALEVGMDPGTCRALGAMYKQPPPDGRETAPAERPDALQPHAQRLTTSFSTAATFVYALGAGITAAAGTRLALQLILIAAFG